MSAISWGVRSCVSQGGQMETPLHPLLATPQELAGPPRITQTVSGEGSQVPRNQVNESSPRWKDTAKAPLPRCAAC